MSNIFQVLTEPRSFFEEIREVHPSVKVPVLVVLLMAVLSAISGYLLGEMSGKLFSSMGSGIGMIAGVSAAFASFLTPFIMWVVIALIFLVLARIVSGSGSFSAYLELVGYGMIPLLVSTLLSLLLELYYLPQVVIHPVHSTDPAQIQEAAMKMVQDPALHQFSLISTVLMIIFLVWAANIWIFGVEARSNLPSRKALMVVALPVGIYILYSLYSLLKISGLV